MAKSNDPSACLLGKAWGYDDKSIWVSNGCSGEFSLGLPAPKRFGRYTPGVGFKIADTEHGDMNIKLFTYVRYLNQKALEGTYTDSFGRTSDVKQRNDVQVNKMIVYFLGWIAELRSLEVLPLAAKEGHQ